MDSKRESLELFDPEVRRRLRSRKPTIAAVVFIAVILVLASLSMLLGGLAQHYHDAKYRSQHWLVVSLSNSILFSESGLSNAMSPNGILRERLSSAVYGQTHLVETQDLSYSIELMYPRDSKEALAFRSVHISMQATEGAMWGIVDWLDNWIQTNISHEFNSTVFNAAQNVTELMDDLETLIYAGVDESRDFYARPYSHVKRMDLDAIIETSNEIEAISGQIGRWVPW